MMNNLIVRTFLGFAFLIIVLGLAMFIPAGSLSFWQAWIYLADFAICTILITAYLIKNDRELLAGRVQAGPAAEKQRSQQIIQSLASLFFIGSFIVPGLDFRFHWSHIPTIISLASDGFVALGSWVALPFALAVILVVVARLLDEEKFLRENLSGYQEYQQKVRYRLIPFIW